MAKESIGSYISSHPIIEKRWSRDNNDHLLRLTIGIGKGLLIPQRWDIMYKVIPELLDNRMEKF